MFGHCSKGDRDFERGLIESARRDPLPLDVQKAWLRFAGDVGRMASSADLAREVTGVQKAAAEDSAGHAGTVAARTIHRNALVWLVVGAMVGSSVTGLILFQRRGGVLPGSPNVEVLVEGSAGVPSNQSETTLPQPATLGTREIQDRTAVVGVSRASKGRRQARSENGTRPSPPAVPTDTASRLAAEVARLDAARSASRAGDFARTVRLVDAYHREFPDGLLAADAEVVAIEALVETGTGDEVARRAGRFQALYPNDPHIERVRRAATAR